MPPTPLPFPSRPPCQWANDVPVPQRIPVLIEESLRRHLQQAADSSVDPSERQTEEELRSWIASSSFNWSMRNHLIDHLQKTLPLASSPEQRSALEQLLKQCQGWSEAELRRTKASLRPLTESDLWRLRVWELKALASELWSRGINGPHPRRMRKLAIYTGAGVRKAQAVEGLWAALNHTSSPV